MADRVPRDEGWMMFDFDDEIGQHRNRYAREKYWMLMLAKLVKRSASRCYNVKKSIVAEVFDDLAGADKTLWTQG